MMLRTAVIATSAAFASAVAGQRSTEIRFANGTNSITVEPGASVPVSIYAVNLPDVGTPFCFGCNGPGMHFTAFYAGFNSVQMNLNGMTSGSAAWSDLTTPPPFVGPPFGSAGTAAGASVLGIITGVGFGEPVTGPEILLWQGTLTVGSSGISLATAIQPVGVPSMTGFELALSHPSLPFHISEIYAAANGTAVIHVPSPAGFTLLALAGLAATRRRSTL